MDISASQTGSGTVSANLRTILLGLMAALGGFGLQAAQAVLLYRRIGRIAGRIERMMVRYRAGRLRRAMERKARLGGAIRKANCTLPRRFGWLVMAGGHRAAGFGAQIDALLRTPEMAELLAAAPQAARILRPLCRALAVEMPGVSAAPRKSRGGERPAIRRRTKPAPEPFRIPLPRGVLTAARRAGYGKA
jgi:hypothetical protein